MNHDNNGSQPGGTGTQIVSPLITLTVGAEPSGAGSNEDTIDFGLRGVTTDFGDWAGSGAATSTTSTTISSSLRLGTLADGEASVTANPAATTDDTTGTDDEDGVTMPAIITEGEYVTIPATILNNSGANSYLSAWIDFNNDGILNNALYNAATATTGERLQAETTVAANASAQTVNLSFSVPPDASPGANRGVRFRLSNAVGTLPTGAGATGEIEDYVVTIACSANTVNPTTLANGTMGIAYSQSLSAMGGTAPYTYAVTSGTLPAGLTLSTVGVLSGTPNTAGSSIVTIRVTDNYGYTGSASVTIVIRGLIIGDMIFNDANNNGLFDGGETGISGAAVQLWNPGADNVIGGTSADSQVGSNFTTTATGLYSFSNLPPGNYFVRVTLPSPFNMTGGTLATTDNNVNNNNDGSQPGGAGTPLFSPVINLAVGAESTTDGDADSSSNRTIDFGAYAGICVGNLVFKDENNNGSYEAASDTVLSGVQLRIFPCSVTDPLTGNPLYSTTSNASGIYHFCVPAGSYYIHVPPSQFATSAVLDNHIPAIGPTDNVVTPIDDSLDQTVLMAFKPRFTGVNTGIFTLTLGVEPTNATGETGAANTSDDTAASNSMSTNVLAAPATYAQWQLDHDGTLLEYALASPFRLEATDALLTRPVPSRPDLVYRLEASTDMQSWTPLAITPSTTFNADNTETTRFAKLDLAPLFAGRETGFIRLKVELDADLNGTAEQVTHSHVQAWSLRTFATAPETFSMPLLRPAVFEGKASVAQNLTLNASTAYFAEIIGEGTRFEIDSSTGSPSWKTAAPAADDLIIIRPHRALATLFTPAAFRSAINPANADRIIFFSGKAYRVFWLKASALGAHWALQTDTTLADGGSTILAPGEGVLVHSRSTEVTIPVSGEVRAWNFVSTLRAGSQLIGSGHPFD